MAKRKAQGAAGRKSKSKRGQRPVSDDEAPVAEAGSAAAAVEHAVDLDLAEARAPAAASSSSGPHLAEGEKEQEKATEDKPAADDPYLLADAQYIQKDTRWRNKQRTLVFCSRGVTSRFRHLCDDIRKLLPHHKSEPKFEKRSKLQEINEVCELKACNNALYFESRKREDLYLWLARVPSGPTMKFQVLNIHTTGEVRLAGNCLLGSRPILHFDKNFGEISYLKLMKEMITQAFGTPRNHPKSKPFHDHIMCFYWLDSKVWFRHYQVSPEAPDNKDDPERQTLTEIGPRFVLDPIRVLGGSFGGQTLYANAFYMSPTALRVQANRLLKNPYVRRLENKADRKARFEDNREEEDPLDEVFT
jgi:ribosome biogenesis protein BRX1